MIKINNQKKGHNHNSFLWCISLILFFLSCHSTGKNNILENEYIENSLSLTNTKWEQTVTQDCISTLYFVTDSSYTENNCEWNLEFDGLYTIIRDTIFLLEMGRLSEIFENDRLEPKHLYTYLYKVDSLVLLNNKSLENRKIVSTFIPQVPICFKKSLLK